MLSIIVALSENNVIGRDNGLPWKLSADLKRLKALTMGHHIIMGRKTWESLGRPLPGRINVVLTNSKNFKAAGCEIVHSTEEAIKISKKDDETFIFGGGEIFKMLLPQVEKIYMTRVHAIVEGNVYFPELKMNEWEDISREEFKADEKNQFDYSFITLKRINPND